jgi:hypothetical protein
MEGWGGGAKGRLVKGITNEGRGITKRGEGKKERIVRVNKLSALVLRHSIHFAKSDHEFSCFSRQVQIRRYIVLKTFMRLGGRRHSPFKW